MHMFLVLLSLYCSSFACAEAAPRRLPWTLVAMVIKVVVLGEPVGLGTVFDTMGRIENGQSFGGIKAMVGVFGR